MCLLIDSLLTFDVKPAKLLNVTGIEGHIYEKLALGHIPSP